MTTTANRLVGCERWGPWKLDVDDRTLDLGPDGARYSVALDDCRTSADVLDRICQIANKGWADDETLAGFVRAINDILWPQANLCSFGRSSTMTRRAIALRVSSFDRVGAPPTWGPLDEGEGG